MAHLKQSVVVSPFFTFMWKTFFESKLASGYMEYEVDDARPRGMVDKRKLGERLWRKTVRHVN